MTNWLDERAEFQRMMAGLRVRDAIAFAEFCDRFEDFLMARIRGQLTQFNLRWLDADDICQEVLVHFWEICPRLLFDGAPAIRRYLTKMARTMILRGLRYSRAGCRDIQRRASNGSGLFSACHCRMGDPQQISVMREFMERAKLVLTSRQQEICALRCADHSWSEIAVRLGVSVNSAQKQLQRAYDRVSDDVHRDDSAYLPRCSSSRR